MSKTRDLFMEQKMYPNEVNPVLFQKNELNENATFPPHFHHEIEILHIICGKIAVTIYGEEYTVSEDKLCFIPSMSIHSIKSLDKSSKYDCCLLNASYFVKENVNINIYSISHIIDDAVLIDDYKKLKNLFFDNRQLFKSTAIKCFSLYFIINLINQSSSKQNTSYLSSEQKLDIIKEVTLFLKEHACEKIDIDAICTKYGYSPSYLSRLFKKYTQTTMNKTLNYYRCINAQKLLMTENMSIMKISEICGYNNYSYFTKTYKECIGELPSATKNKYFS